ncbi:hypothetical protein [Mycetocola lacteus]|nr:hypothetical protein [Mycetocola lacteus]
MTAALRAEYGLSLPTILRARTMLLTELADLVSYLPAGSALWQSVGGPLAISDAIRAGQAVAHTIQMVAWSEGGRKGPKPEIAAPPPYAHERREQERVMTRKAEAYRRRQQRE